MIKHQQFILLSVFFIIGLFFRTWRQTQLLGFYYDQGRDAQMALDIINMTNLPAIGPTTGIEGLHLGPFWYYLITPAYILSKGNPAIAACIISFLEALTIPFLYLIVKKYFHTIPAILSSFIWATSYYIIRSSRWFSNPTPLPLVVSLLLYILCLIFIDKKYKYIWILVLLLSLSLQLEAASAIFFLPSLVLIFLANRKSLTAIFTKTNTSRSMIVFFITLLPQIAFEIKNGFPTSKTLVLFLFGHKNSTSGKSWAIPSLKFIFNRLVDYYKIFFSKLDTNLTFVSIIYLVLFFVTLIVLFNKFKQNKFVQISFIWLFTPLICLLFFVGNYGRLYDYYLTGFFVPFIIIFSCFPLIFNKKILRYILVLVFLTSFYFGNFPFTKNYIVAGVDGPTHISLGNQFQAIDHICQDKSAYNLFIYVPPIIPYSYQYLIDYRFKNNQCHLPVSNSSTVYLLYEVDLVNPSNLYNWLNQYKGYNLINTINFGGITVSKLKYDQI